MFRGAKNAMISFTHVILFYPVYFCIVMADEIEAREALRLMLRRWLPNNQSEIPASIQRQILKNHQCGGIAMQLWNRIFH